MSMALGAPNSAFVGVDLAEAPIALGRDLARAAGLDNVSSLRPRYNTGRRRARTVRLHHRAWRLCLGSASVRGALLRLAAQCLKPDGLVFISYNVLPGCRLRQALRDLMCDAARGIDDPAQKVGAAREALSRFIELWSEDDPFQKRVDRRGARRAEAPARGALSR